MNYLDLFIVLSMVLGLLGLLVSLGIYFYITRQSQGSDKMRGIADLIHEGAMAFLKKEYMYLTVFIVVVTILLMLFISNATALAFIVGAAFSIFAGFVGMKAATRSNVRTGSRKIYEFIPSGRKKAFYVWKI